MSESECCSLANYQEKQIFSDPLIMVDTPMLLRPKERHCLTHFFNVYIPSAVSWQIKKLKQRGSRKGRQYVENHVEGAKKILFQMFKQNKWKRFKSKKGDIVEEISQTQFRDFCPADQEKLRKYFNEKAKKRKELPDYKKMEVRTLIGQTDIQILADAYRLQKQEEQKVILATSDHILSLVAEVWNIATVSTLQRPDLIKVVLQG